MKKSVKSVELKKRQEALEKLILSYCRKGDAGRANAAARELGRKLNEDEQNVLVFAFLDSGDIWGALEQVKQGVSQEAAAALEKILQQALAAGRFYLVFPILKQQEKQLAGAVAIRFLRKLMRSTINSSDKEALQTLTYVKAADLKDVSEALLKIFIAQGEIQAALNISQKLMRRQLSQPEVDELVLANIKLMRPRRAIAAAGHGASAACVEKLVKVCIRSCDEESARLAARINQRKLGATELKAILHGSLRKGYIFGVASVCKKTPVSATQWQRLMRMCLANGDIEDALAVARLRGRELSVAEIERLNFLVSR